MILWAPHPAMQTELLQATEFEVFAGGAAGPGKSDALLVAGLLYTHISTYRALILRASFPELRRASSLVAPPRPVEPSGGPLQIAAL